MRKLVAIVAALSAGCATILNSSEATVTPPPGATVDGFPGSVALSQKHTHEVTYPDGRRCVIDTSVGAGYVLVDLILLPLLIPIVVDGVTGNWKSLDENCPGVRVD